MKNKSQQQQHTEHTINLMELNSRRLIFSITISSETLDFVFIFFSHLQLIAPMLRLCWNMQIAIRLIALT